MRLTSGPILCACLACLSLTACKDEVETATHNTVRPARVTVVVPQKFVAVSQGAGRIEARFVSQVGFEVSGRVISRSVDIGTVVTKGQTLAALSDTDFQNKVTAAEADLATARATLAQVAAQEARDRVLTERGHTSRAAYDVSLKALNSAEAAVQSAEANLRIARNQLDHAQLRAPSDGVVTATGADPGQVVEVGQMIVEISRDSEREAVFSVASEDIARASRDMPARIWLQAQPQVAVTGFVREISPVADSTTGTYEVRVALPSAPQEMRLGAIIVGRAEAEGQRVTTLPATALLQSGDTAQVWVVSENNTVHRRDVELLEFDMDTVVLGSGLEPGEVVVTAGINALAEGQNVKPETEVR